MKNFIKSLPMACLLTVLWGCQPQDSSPLEDEEANELTDSTAATEVLELVSGVQLDALDRSTRPQDDFYQFANGGWLDRTEIPEIYSGYTVYHQVYEDAEQALKTIIEDAAANPGEAGSESQQVGDTYNSFMNEALINQLGVEAIRPELDQVAAIENQEDLARVMAQLLRNRINMPFRLSIDSDLKNSSRYIAYLGQSGITMPNRDYYLQTDNENFRAAREALPAYIASMLQRAGSDPAKAEADARDVYAIEAAIAEAQWDSVDLRDPEKAYNPYAASELAKLGGNQDWPLILKELGLQDVETLIIEQPSYMEALDGLIASIPLESWKAYLSFHVMDGRGSDLDDETAAIRFDYRARILNGQEEERPRWKRGISVVNSFLGEAVGKLYVAEYFPPEAKIKMEQLVDNVIATLDDNLTDLDWMSEETRQRARQKLESFNTKIGYPDVWEDYSQLEIIKNDHMGNLRRVIEWDHLDQVEKLSGPVDKNEWFMTPQTVNAYYDPTKNEIVFPAARLQAPFFQLNADDAINYGAVGGVIGHEISHGFDDQGSKFDGEGNLENWWNEADRAAFEQRTSVIVDQYNAFEPIPGMRVNGELTLGENIGDLSGVAMAYNAYISSLNGEEARIIDGFTGPQRFFIGYAMSRRGKYQEASAISQLSSDPHSPLKYRVNGIYPNIDAFHEAFDTKEGDGMWLAPEERVRIW